MRSHAEWLELASAQMDRFWSKVDKNGPPHPSDPGLGQCWIWTTGKCKDGYGKFAITAPRGERPLQKHVRAHRFSYEMVSGASDPTLAMLHSCDRPACVNPAHLRPGTAGENYADAKRRGRNTEGIRHGMSTRPGYLPRGERHYRARLTEIQVVEAIELYASGERPCDLARRYGVSQNSILSAVTGRSWKHLHAGRSSSKEAA